MDKLKKLQARIEKYEGQVEGMQDEAKRKSMRQALTAMLQEKALMQGNQVLSARWIGHLHGT